MTRFFRIYAIIYTHYYRKYVDLSADRHLNTSFKHFMFFCFEYDIINNSEFDALSGIVTELRTSFDSRMEVDG